MPIEEIKKKLKEETLHSQEKKLFKDPRNIKIVQEAMFSSTNELYGTSYKSRIDDPNTNLQAKLVPHRSRELVCEKENLI